MIMLNQIVLVGRLTGEPRRSEDNRKAVITLAVPRSYKNADGEYETDFIPCILWNGIAENAMEYCRQGDLVGVKGRLQNEGQHINVVAEKLTFLSSRPSNNERDDD
jgi:single-strand DNA-binding protein